MLKKFLGGLATGAGFGISFVGIWIIGLYFILPRVMNSHTGPGSVLYEEHEVDAAPKISPPKRFLGSTGIYSGDFPHDRQRVLASGPGSITGGVSVNGEPLAGLKLRLALNGSVMSQWATSDENGRYSIGVPFGTYVVHGFELDHETANARLPNKINHPQRANWGKEFAVAEGIVGQGLDFKFVDPVVKRPAKEKYAAGEPVVLEWDAYPNAVDYLVQVYEKQDRDSWNSRSVFSGYSMPDTADTRFDLKAHGVELKPGHVYTFSVHARDERHAILSETAPERSGYDFEVTD